MLLKLLPTDHRIIAPTILTTVLLNTMLILLLATIATVATAFHSADIIRGHHLKRSGGEQYRLAPFSTPVFYDSMELRAKKDKNKAASYGSKVPSKSEKQGKADRFDAITKKFMVI